MKLIAFDFDGTLVNNWLQTVEKLEDAAEVAGVSITARDRVQLRRKGWITFFRSKDFPTLTLAKLLLSFFSKMKNPHGDYLHIPEEVVTELVELAAAGNYLSIVSSANTEFVESVIKQHGLVQVFKSIYGDEPTWRKHNRLRRLRQEILADQYYYIGDEIRDAAAANKAGYIPIGVSWGYQDISLLRTRFKKIARTPEELRALLAN